jgi:hypothetical protein
VTALFLALGCGRVPLPFDPAAEVERIRALRVPEEQVAAIDELLARHPEQANLVCELLPEGPGRARCNRMRSRPHLWSLPPPPDAGPTVELLSSVASRYAGVEPATGECPSGAQLRACLETRALSAGREGDAQTAAALCAAVAETRWRDECAFRAAESLVNAHGSAQYGDATELCLASGEYRSLCLSHLLIRLSATAPDAGTREGWEEVREVANQLDTSWRARDPALADRMVERFWSYAMAVAYRRVLQVTGDPLDHVPKSVVPALRASAALRLLALERADSLAAWVAALEAALHRRGAEADLTIQNRLPPGEERLWGDDAPPRGARIAIVYGSAYRLVAEGEAGDLAVCVLEAAARLRQADPRRAAALLAEGRAHKDPVVRWTAERLQGQARVVR